MNVASIPWYSILFCFLVYLTAWVVSSNECNRKDNALHRSNTHVTVCLARMVQFISVSSLNKEIQ